MKLGPGFFAPGSIVPAAVTYIALPPAPAQHELDALLARALHEFGDRLNVASRYEGNGVPRALDGETEQILAGIRQTADRIARIAADGKRLEERRVAEKVRIRLEAIAASDAIRNRRPRLW